MPARSIPRSWRTTPLARRRTKLSRRATAEKFREELHPRGPGGEFADKPDVGDDAPRPPRVDGDYEVQIVAQRNPKKPGTRAHARFGLYADGMSVRAYVARVEEAGFTRRDALADLSWDARHGFVRLRPPEAKYAPPVVRTPPPVTVPPPTGPRALDGSHSLRINEVGGKGLDAYGKQQKARVLRQIKATLDANTHPRIRERLAQVGVRVSVSDRLSQLPGMSGQPPGWPEGSSWDDCGAAYEWGARHVKISAKVRMRGAYLDADRVVHSLHHEVGHAVDNLGGGYGGGYSSRPNFVEAHAADAAEIPSHIRERLAYFIQPSNTAGGRSEAWAELYASYHMPGYAESSENWINIQERFPRTNAVFLDYLRRLKE